VNAHRWIDRGVASGKTAVSEVLKEEALISSMQTRLQGTGSAPRTRLERTRQDLWRGNSSRGRSIDRKKLADRVFVDPNQRKLLNQILHPLITEEMDRRTREIGQKNPEAIV